MPTDLKQRIAEMKEAAEALKGVKSGCDITNADPRFVDFIMKCAPVNVLALIAEIERLEGENERIRFRCSEAEGEVTSMRELPDVGPTR